MAGLGDTTAAIAARRRALAGATQRHRGGGRMTEIREFGPNPGGLTMLTHRPADLVGPAPLVVVLHGCTQGAEAHAASGGWLQLADRFGFTVLAPQQEAANNPNRCFNWFEPQDQRRGAGEPASIRAMIAHLEAAGQVDPSRIFVTGLSAGGAMAAVMLATYPEVFVGGAVVAGLPYGAANSLQSALGAMAGRGRLNGTELAGRLRKAAPAAQRLPRLSIWHGRADHTVNAANAGATASQWALAQGLAEQPDAVETLRGRSRSVWCSASGEDAIELHLIDGLGHGTPLAALGEDAVGFPAPYMLEAGVSSSMEIAGFWGLAPPTARIPRALEVPPPQRSAPAGPSGDIGQTVMDAISRHVPADVQRVIADALRKAGLR